MNRQRVLITGSEGFLGKFVVHVVKSLGWTAVPFTVDLKDGEKVRKFVSDEGPFSFVLHLASISHPAECEKDPEKAFLINTGGTLSLLESIFPLEQKPRFIFFSTAQVYQPSENLIGESDSLRLGNVYSRTKLNAESIIQTYGNLGNLPSTIFRLFNHSHFTQPNLYFLPSIYEKLNQLGKEKTEVKVGDLNQTRDFSSLQDFQKNLYSFLKSSQAEDGFEVFNFCSGRAYSLQKLADALAQKLGKDPIWVQSPSADKSTGRLVGNPKNLSSRIPFQVSHRTEVEFIEQFLGDPYAKFTTE